MTKGKWGIVCIGILTLGLVATSLVSARPGRSGRGGGHGLFPLRILQTLDLTGPQQTDIDVIKAAHADALEGLKNDLREARKEIVDIFFTEGELTAEDFVTQQGDLSQIHADLHADLFDELLAMGLEIRAVLTPEQLAEAAAAIERMRELRAEMRAIHAQGQ